MKFEELIDEYEKASKEKTSDSFKMGTVIDSVPATVRQHILLNIKEDTNYDDLRTFLTTYENAKRWTQPTTTDLINSGKDHGGQAAMDVSQVKGNYKGKGKRKGKGKDQSKGKGKGGDKGGWSKGGRKGNWKGGRGRGGRFGKGSYKGGGKGYSYKGKGKGKDNYHKGNSAPGVCNYCQKYGHYEAQCRKKQRDMAQGIRNVQEDEQSEAPTSVSTAAPTTSTRTAATASATTSSTRTQPKVRQVTLFHIGEEPEQAQGGPQIYPIDSEEETNYEMTYFNNIMMVQMEVRLYEDSEEEEQGSQSWKDDPLYRWYNTEEPAVLSVRTVRQDSATKPRNIEVILDSGADVSIAPSWMKKYGKKIQVKNVQLRDAQGKSIAVQEHRLIDLEFKDKTGNKVQVSEVFMIGNVINPLLAIGKMMKQGWMPHLGDSSRMALVDGDKSTEIPIYFRNNSLAASAFVQAVVAVREGQLVPVLFSDTLQQLEKRQRPGWCNPEEGKIHYGMNNSHFVDPTMTRSFHESLFYRTTFVKENKENKGQWILVEINRPYQEMEDPFMELPYSETETITVFTSQPESPVRFCKAKGTDHNVEFEVFTDDKWEVSITGEEVIRYHYTPRKFLFNPSGVPGCPTDLSNFDGTRSTYGIHEDTGRSFEDHLSFREQPGAQDRMPMQPSLLWTGETRFRLREPLQLQSKKQKTGKDESMEVDEEAQPSGAQAEPEAEAEQAEEEPAAPADRREVVEGLSFVHEGWEYSVDTTLKDLRDLCKELGVSQKGTKKEILRRLSKATREGATLRNRAGQEKAFKEHIEPQLLPKNEKPSQEEVEKHNLTHLPYKAWCPICVANKGKESPHKSLFKKNDDPGSSMPTICLDFCFTTTSLSKEQASIVLIAVDSWSGTVAAVPTSQKGRGLIDYMSDAVVSMASQLQYSNIILKGDNENTMQTLKAAIQKKRTAQGMGTHLQDSVTGQHQTNGIAERMIQTVRRQALCHVQMLQEKAGLGISHQEAVFAWAFRHAAWCLNRFHTCSSTGMTPHEFFHRKALERKFG